MNMTRHILISGGGTGGHLFPALAVAAALRTRLPDVSITVCGTGRDWERERVRAAGLDYRAIAAAPWSLRPVGLWRAVTRNHAGYRQARQLIAETMPQVVIAVGGYNSVPVGLAARAAEIPLVLIEPNVIPGRANWLLAHSAAAVCTGFEETVPHLPRGARPIVTGVPLRADFTGLGATVRDVRQDSPPQLLILGGSQGARSLNQAVGTVLPLLARRLAGWRIVHQTGQVDYDRVRAQYSGTKLTIEVTPFLSSPVCAYAGASLAICRAGASTLAELAVAGVPAILVPYPHAAGDHQWHNARVLAQSGAARLVRDDPDRVLTAGGLRAELEWLLASPAERARLTVAVRRFARPHAVDQVCTVALSAGGYSASAESAAA
jgi:UDP-N-acetylglucosamine--N-acetylmuramyl-(pentapeptide) pyrophosphoryl-undecaprenol N-acetylglucosamine transferase